MIIDFVVILDDKIRMSFLLVIWFLRLLDSLVIEDRIFFFVLWFQFISLFQRNFKVLSKELTFLGGILILFENLSLKGKKY